MEAFGYDFAKVFHAGESKEQLTDAFYKALKMAADTLDERFYQIKHGEMRWLIEAIGA